MILEEYKPGMYIYLRQIYIVADALSHFALVDSMDDNLLEIDSPLHTNAHYFSLEKLQPNLYSVKHKTIAEDKQKDSALVALAKTNSNYTVNIFYGGGKK